MNRKGNAGKPGKQITGFILAVLLVLTMTGCAFRGEKKNPSETEPVTKTAPQEDPSDNQPVSETESTTEDVEKLVTYDDVSYEQLIANLNENTKRFDPELQAYVKEIVSIAYQNAGELSDVLRSVGVPDREVLLNEKVVKSLGKIDRLRIIHQEDDDYYPLYQKYTASRYVEEENAIYVFIVDWNSWEQVQIVLEELIHAGQDAIGGKSLSYSFFEILTEGEANLYAWPMGFGNINNDSLDFMYFKDNDDDLFQMYGAGYHDHAVASKYYVYLLSLVGYKTMNALYYDGVDMKAVADKLTQLYKIDGEHFLSLMDDVMVDLASSIPDARTNMMLEVEKTYNKCLMQKVSKLSSKEEVEAFLNLYRFINLQFGTRHSYHDPEKDTYQDVTAEDSYLSRASLESVLFEKAKSFGILEDLVSGWPEEETTQKQIFEMLVDSPRPKEDRLNFYSVEISASKIAYSPKDRSLTIQNQNGSDCTIMLDTGEVTGMIYENAFS